MSAATPILAPSDVPPAHKLVELRGASVVQDWQDKVRAGQFRDVFRDLLERHYDPGYSASIRRNFQQVGTAQALAPRDHSMAAMDAVARDLAGEG